MATTPYQLRFGEKLIWRVKKVAEKRELSFAMTCRLLLSERLDELGIECEAPETATTPETGATFFPSISDVKKISVSRITDNRGNNVGVVMEK